MNSHTFAVYTQTDDINGMVETYMLPMPDDVELLHMIQDNRNGTALIAKIKRSRATQQISSASLKRVQGSSRKMDTYLSRYRVDFLRFDLIGKEILCGEALEDAFVWDIEYFEVL